MHPPQDATTDLATGFTQGEPGHEIVGCLCGATAMARAYDEQSDAWSNLLDVDAGC